LRGDQQRPLDGDPGVALMFAKVRARGAATKDVGCCRETSPWRSRISGRAGWWATFMR
jgi:hypothetical protein